MKVIRSLLIFCVAAAVAACSHSAYSTKNDSYLTQAKTTHLMVIPPGASAPDQAPYYTVPAKAVKVNKDQPNLVPPGFHDVTYKGKK